MKRTAALPLNERVQLDAVLDAAYAPLRLSGTGLSPARVRAAVRWAPASAPPLRGAALIGRAGELATAVAAAAFVFAASLAPILPAVEDSGRSALPADVVRVAPGLSLDRPETFARWLRVGRTVTADDLLDPLDPLDPLLGVSGVARGSAADQPPDTLDRVRQGLAR